MGFTLLYAGGDTFVASNDDFEEFDTLLDRYEHRPSVLVDRLELYLKRHPGHVDALAHLCLAALEDGRREAVLWALQVGELLRAALEDAPDGPVPLPWERFENRPVLRLARNATLVMWEAQLWGLAERLVAYWERIDTTGEAAEWQAQISQRRVRPELTDA